MTGEHDERDEPWLRLPTPPEEREGRPEARDAGDARVAGDAGEARDAGEAGDGPWLRLDPHGVEDQRFNRDQAALQAKVARGGPASAGWLRAAEDEVGPLADAAQRNAAQRDGGHLHAPGPHPLDPHAADPDPVHPGTPSRGTFATQETPVDAPDPRDATDPRGARALAMPEPDPRHDLVAMVTASSGREPSHDEQVVPGRGDAGGGNGRDAGQDQRDARDEPGAASVLGTVGKEFLIVVGMALVLSFIVKSLLLQAFYIPSGSMEDTLQVNDRVIVSKLTPGPFDLKRGDIVVFADPGDWLGESVPVDRGPVMTAVHEGLMFVGLLPDDAENHLIKRVIGLPGDHVVCCDKAKRLTVNGSPIIEPYLRPGVSPSDFDFDITVPKGKVWVMGDNRSNSADSRYHPQGGDGQEGSVSEDLIVGRAVALVWPLRHLSVLTNPSSTFASVPEPFGQSQTGTTPPSSTPTP